MPDDRSVLARAARAPDATVAYGTGADNVADVWLGDARASARPLVVLIHGGFWRPEYDRRHTAPMGEALSAAGWTVATLEYRRVPQHPDLMIEDVTNALRIVPSKVKDHDGRCVVMGHSAGGHLALWAASARPAPELTGAVALGPAADLRLAHEMGLGDGAALAFLGEPPEKRSDLDPRRMPSPQIATTIVHGEEDDIVPIALSESYVAAHPRVPLVRLPGVGHFAVIDPLSAVWGKVVGALESVSLDR